MWNYIKMSFPDSLLLLLLPSIISAQPSPISDVWLSVSENLSSSASNMNSTEEDKLSASMQPPLLDPSPQATTKENEDWPKNYLYTSNASLLSSSTCHQSFQLPAQHGAIPPDLQSFLCQVSVSLTNTINFLNLIFQASELRETSVREDIEWYHAMVRSMLVGERSSLIRRAQLTFDADPAASQPLLVLQTSRGWSSNIYLQDLTLAWKTQQLSVNRPDQSWLTSEKSGSLPPGLSKQVLLNDLSTLDTPKWAQANTYVSNSSGVWWGEAPFLECKDGHYLPGWLLTLSMPFYGLKPDLNPEYRGAIQVDVNIQGFDVNQCATGDVWFANTHQCNRTSMECEPIPGQGFRLDQYYCRCKEGYYSLSPDLKDQFDTGAGSTRVPVCLPCWPGCKRCQVGTPCRVEENWLLRTVLLAMQSYFMALVLFSMPKAYQYRGNRRIRVSGLLLLEIILFGSLLLYFPVFILYFKPSTFRCILLRWVRLLGFAIVYGTIMMKMYRLLNVFLSCTTQRVPYMSSASVMKILGVLVLIVNWFLCSWTAGALQNQDRNVPLLISLTTSDGQNFTVCDLDRWDYMMALAELLFLCWGSLLGSAVKAVPSAFHEPRYMGIAIHNELFFSTIFHLLRFIRPSLHPDRMLLLFFIHTHLTITVTLCLLFIPKFLYTPQLAKEEIATEMYEDEVDRHCSCIHLNSSFASACWNDHTLDPDDIRDELKKLYSRLEIYKTKKMANNNPHLQKKRSSRLMLGQSIIKHITEIPESMSRQYSHKNKDTFGARRRPKCSECNMGTSGNTCVPMKHEMAKSPSQKTQKSYSVCENDSQTDSTLFNSSVEKRNDKRASKAESIDTAPVICKSASAHNLAVDSNLLQPVPFRVQKSFSFTEKDTDHYPRYSSKSIENAYFALEVNQEDKSLQTQTSIKKNHEICPWGVKKERSAGTNISNQKQVINDISQQEPQTSKDISSPSRLYICPWESAIPLTPPSPPMIEKNCGVDFKVDSQRPKPAVSSNAQESPSGFAKATENHVFSFRSATRALLLARGLVARKMHDNNSSKKEISKEEGTLNQTKIDQTQCSTLSSGKKTPQIRHAMTYDMNHMTYDSKPCLVKQAAIRMSSNDISERSSSSNYAAHISSWKSEDIIIKKLTTDLIEICPWEVPDEISWISDETKKEAEKDHSFIKSELGSCNVPGFSTSEVNTESPKSASYARKLTEKVSYVNASDKELDINKKTLVRQVALHNCVCPWDTSETQTHQKRNCVDVCPCKTDNIPRKNSEKGQSTESKSTTKSLLLAKQLTSTVEICPWDFPESPQLDSHAPQQQEHGYSTVCPRECSNASLEEQQSETVKKNVSTQNPLRHLTSTEDICPWDFPETSSTLTDVYSSGSEEAFSKSKTITIGLPSTTQNLDVCPWEAFESSDKKGVAITSQKQENGNGNICSVELEQAPKSTEFQNKIRADICHYEQACSEKSKESVCVDICPWETNCEKPTNSEDSTDVGKIKVDIIAPTAQVPRANRPLARCDALCPWEVKGESQTSTIKQDSLDVFTWEEPILEEEEADAETAAESLIFPPDL